MCTTTYSYEEFVWNSLKQIRHSLLFSVFVKDIVNHFKSYKYLLFVDDLKMYMPVFNIGDWYKLNNDIDTLINWYLLNGNILNLDKELLLCTIYIIEGTISNFFKLLLLTSSGIYFLKWLLLIANYGCMFCTGKTRFSSRNAPTHLYALYTYICDSMLINITKII